MKNLPKIIALSIIIGIILSSLAGRCSKSEIIVKRDTIVVYDTIKVLEPIVRDSLIVRTEKVYLPIVRTDTDSVVIVDSVNVEIPIVQKVYSDSLYTAWVSGFRPNLDSLHIYNKEKIITIETIERLKQKRWHIGVGTGVGTDFKGVQPYIGIGVYYSFISF